MLHVSSKYIRKSNFNFRFYIRTKHVHVRIVLVVCVVNDCSICNNIALGTVSNDGTRLCHDSRDLAVLIWLQQ